MEARRWVVGTFGGWTLGFALAIAFILAAEGMGLRETQFPLALGMGVGVGFMQGRLVAPVVGDRRRWWIATALGLALPFAVADIAGRLDLSVGYSLAPYVVLGGITAGLLQWRILRANARRAVLWIGASGLGWALAAATVYFNDRHLPRIPGIVGALLYIGVILIGGILLGLVGALGFRAMSLAPRPRPS